MGGVRRSVSLGLRDRSLQPKEFRGARYGARGNSAHLAIGILAHKFFYENATICHNGEPLARLSWMG